MILTKEDQEAIVHEYAKDHNTDRYCGFVDGILATIKLINEKRIEQDIMKEALKRIYNESI